MLLHKTALFYGEKAEYDQGYADGYAARGTGTISYVYHHHATSGSNIHVNDSSTKTGGIADSYHSSTSGGCFTQVVYKAHSHTSSCYSSSTCYHRAGISHSWFDDGDGRYMCVSTCQSCGQSATVDTGHSRDYSESDDALYANPYTYTALACGKTAGTRYSSEGVDYYTKTCSYSNGQIVQAIISY